MKKWLMAIGGVFLFSSVWACPTKEGLERTLRSLNPRGEIRVLEVSPLKDIKGLCEVVVSHARGKGVLYTDESGRFLILGRIIDLKRRVNVTEERLTEVNKISKEKIAKLREFVAFTAGKGPEVFFITDPDCPFCKRAEKILWELILENKVKVNVVFFPLEALHPQAKAKAISMICEKKGFEDLLTGYSGNKTCTEGVEKVEKGMKFIKELGLKGTPTYIFPSGKMYSGVLSKERLLELLRHES